MRRLLLLAGTLVLAMSAGSSPPRPAHLPVRDSLAPGLRVERGPITTDRARTRWCGSDGTASDRPDTVGSNQVHVIYAVPSDQQDALAVRATAIVSDLQAADDWWRRQASTRTVRLDLAAFAGCDSELGRLDVSEVRLTRPSSAYLPDPLFPVLTELRTSPLDFTRQGKDYLIYYDGPSENTRLCGEAAVNITSQGYSGYAMVFLRACVTDLGQGSFDAATAAHEVTHLLGAVPPQAPNFCAGHVCAPREDLMYPNLSPLANAVLDPGRDDYYGHSGAWWDVQDSPYLRHLGVPSFPVTVTVEGTGPGTVASDGPGVACPGACGATWEAGSSVTLRAIEGERSRFVGWGGACSSGGYECTLTVDGAKTVTATFAGQVTLGVRVVAREHGAGGVVVSRPDLIGRCDDCEQDVDKGTVVTLVPQPGVGSRFLGWAGDCAGVGPCRLTLERDTSVRALVGLARYAVSVSVSGRGSVTSTPRGVSCPGRCATDIRYGTKLTLRAHPARGWRLAGWSGGCSGTGGCALKVHRDAHVVARFVRS